MAEQQLIGLPPAEAVTTYTNGIHPVWDMSNLSWDDLKSTSRIGERLQNAKTADEVDKSTTMLEELFGKALVSVPRSWLVKSAPADIDWSVPGMFGKWLRGDHMLMLRKSFADAQDFESASGNSEAH